MFKRIFSRPFYGQLLCVIICLCSLLALALFMSVGSTLHYISPKSEEDYFNYEPCERVEPLDPAVAINMLREGGAEYRFQWSHWVNLAHSEQYDYGNLDPASYPHLSSIDDLASMPMPFVVHTTQREAAMIGELYCRHRMAAPSRVIQLSEPSDNSTESAPESWLVRHANSSLDQRQYGHTEYIERDLHTAPFAGDLRSDDPRVRLLPVVGDDLFRWDARKEAAAMETSGNSQEQEHAKMLRAAVAHVKTSGKHFQEAHLLRDSAGFGNHYDWRFFRGVETYTERVQTIQAIVRAWNQFSEQFGIESWWAHGSALGWEWNGLAMPWDMDTDIQVPIRTLDRLAWELNYTLIVQPPSEGSRAFLFEVGPWYVERSNGNGLNVIDARFIDITTGTYADITGLAYFGFNTKVGCKNGHYYAHDEISPLRETKFEGANGYMPAKTSEVLDKEYKKARVPTYEKWSFNARSRLWSCVECGCTEEDMQSDRTCYPVDPLPWNECKYSLYGTCDRLEIEEYETTRYYTEAHELEMQLWEQVPTTDVDSARSAEAVSELVHLMEIDYPPMHRRP